MSGVPSFASAQKPVWLSAGQCEGLLDMSGKLVGKQIHDILMSYNIGNKHTKNNRIHIISQAFFHIVKRCIFLIAGARPFRFLGAMPASQYICDISKSGHLLEFGLDPCLGQQWKLSQHFQLQCEVNRSRYLFRYVFLLCLFD